MHNHDVKPFRTTHLIGLTWREQQTFLGMSETLKKLYEASPGFSGFCNGEFVAAGGIVAAAPWLGEAWAVAGPLVLTHRVWFHRAIRSRIMGTARMMGLRRLQCVASDWSAAWIESLGFHREATMRKYGPNGEDAYMYAMFPQESPWGT